MQKTTVYLSDDLAEGLRQMAAATGRSQADLIREAVGRVLGRGARRRFRSMGRGEFAGRGKPSWKPGEVYEKAFGRR